MNILIIGSDSNIARNFILLYRKYYTIYSVSRISTGYENEHVIPDLTAIPDNVYKKIDIVINFTAIVHQPKAPDDIYYAVNYKLAIRIAEKAKLIGIKLFIQMSTVAVYGQFSNISIHSNEEPKNAYGRSKLLADNHLLKMQDENFKVLIVRPPMVYGSSHAPGNMIRLIKLADSKLPLPFKDIENKRNFIHIFNLVYYIKTAIDNNLSGKILLCDNDSISTYELLQIINKYLHKKSYFFKPPFIILRLLKKVTPAIFEKLYGDSLIQSNFPLEFIEPDELYSIEEGIEEMVTSYINKRG